MVSRNILTSARYGILGIPNPDLFTRRYAENYVINDAILVEDVANAAETSRAAEPNTDPDPAGPAPASFSAIFAIASDIIDTNIVTTTCIVAANVAAAVNSSTAAITTKFNAAASAAASFVKIVTNVSEATSIVLNITKKSRTTDEMFSAPNTIVNGTNVAAAHINTAANINAAATIINTTATDATTVENIISNKNKSKHEK